MLLSRFRAGVTSARNSAPAVDFRNWRRGRPFVGAALTILAGIELFFSGQLDLGNIHVQVGIEGLQSTIIPVVMVTLGVLIALMPMHRIFYGVISLAVAVYSLIGLNLGGFFVGMLLGAVGGILVVSWLPKPVPTDAAAEPVTKSPSTPRRKAPSEPPPLASSRS